MAETVKLEVATPLGKALDVDSESVQVPGVAGEFGVLSGHLPILAAVKPGVLAYRDGGQLQRVAIGGGFAEADAVHVRVITEFFTTADEVDLADAQKDLETANGRLKEHKGEFGDPAYREAQRDADWAQARIDLAKLSKN